MHGQPEATHMHVSLRLINKFSQETENGNPTMMVISMRGTNFERTEWLFAMVRGLRGLGSFEETGCLGRENVRQPARVI